MNDSRVSLANLQEELALGQCYKGIVGYKRSALAGVLHIKPKRNVLLLNVVGMWSFSFSTDVC